MTAPRSIRPLLLLATLLTGSAMTAGCPSGKAQPAPVVMVEIPGGTYRLGSTMLACGDASSADIERCDSGNANADPLLWLDNLSWAVRAEATVETFSIDVSEVSNAHYAVCVDDGACTPPAFSTIDGAAYYGDPDYDDHPVVYVSWGQARSYCAYRGKRLPTRPSTSTTMVSSTWRPTSPSGSTTPGTPRPTAKTASTLKRASGRAPAARPAKPTAPTAPARASPSGW